MMRPQRHVIQGRENERAAELFRKHGEQLARYLTRVLGSAALAQDAIQDTYERLCTNIKTVENQPAYLFRVGMRFALMRLRRVKVEAKDVLRRIPLEDGPDVQAGPETRAMHDQSIDHLGTQIALLPPALREVMVMRYLQGMEPAEITDRLGISISAYEQRLTAAKHQLRRRLRTLGLDPQVP
jgi:RNA polymerase sigma factor (sigma-70 family)